MSESTRDRGCSGASSFQEDLSKLVAWAHTHGTICNQIPTLELIQNMDLLSNDNAMLWMCRVGHAYHWHLNNREEDTEAVGRSKRVLSSESLSREFSVEEKKIKLTPSSFEMGQTNSGCAGSSGRSQGITEQKPDSAYTRNKKPERSQNTSKPVTSFSAPEQHFSVSGSRGQTGKQHVKSESDEDLQVMSYEEQCEADEDNQGDRISQNNVSEPSAKELQMLHHQNMALHQPTTSQRAAFAPMARPPLTCASILQDPVSDSKDPSRNILRLGPFSAAEPVAETSRAWSLSESAAPKTCFKLLPIPSTKTRAQHESQPLETFFEFEATADVQQHLQLSSPECGTLGMGSSRDSAENVDEDSSTSGSELTPCSLALQTPESHSPPASDGDVLKKLGKRKSYILGRLKVFTEWLKLHHPSEMRKIYELPPADLDHYLVLFFSSAKRQDGMDFSARTLTFFQRAISKYLKDHNYQYNMLRGPEFRASQKACKLKHWRLFQKKEEEEKEWSLVENLTDEDVESLFKKEILSKTHPQGLLHLMFTNLIRGFGARTHHQAHQLYWGQVVLQKTKEGVEYLEWKDDLSPGGNKGEVSPRLFAKPEDPMNCPVSSYKQYATKRPPDMLDDYHPLYLSPKSLCSIWDNVWYIRKAMAKAKMNKIIKVITQDVREAIKKTRK